MEPLISVIVPVYKVEPYLKKCVDSILGQTYRNLEVILVDDGSPDNCPAICDAYAAQDKRVRVIHKENGGLSDARNAGLDVATGDYIGFVDSDDWIEADMFEYLLRGMLGNNAQISICREITIWEFSLEIKGDDTDSVYSNAEALRLLFNDQLENYAWNKLYKASLWDNVRFPKGKNFEDILTIYKTFEQADRICFLHEGKYYYLIRPDSISGTRNFKNRLEIFTAITERYREAAPRMPQYRAQLFRRIRWYYIHELCEMILQNPAQLDENRMLLDILAPFVAEVKDSLIPALGIHGLERKKIEAFAEGTIEGCRKSLRYHRMMKRVEKLKNLIKKL